MVGAHHRLRPRPAGPSLSRDLVREARILHRAKPRELLSRQTETRLYIAELQPPNERSLNSTSTIITKFSSTKRGVSTFVRNLPCRHAGTCILVIARFQIGRLIPSCQDLKIRDA